MKWKRGCWSDFRVCGAGDGDGGGDGDGDGGGEGDGDGSLPRTRPDTQLGSLFGL